MYTTLVEVRQLHHRQLNDVFAQPNNTQKELYTNKDNVHNNITKTTANIKRKTKIIMYWKLTHEYVSGFRTIYDTPRVFSRLLHGKIRKNTESDPRHLLVLFGQRGSTSSTHFIAATAICVGYCPIFSHQAVFIASSIAVGAF